MTEQEEQRKVLIVKELPTSQHLASWFKDEGIEPVVVTSVTGAKKALQSNKFERIVSGSLGNGWYTLAELAKQCGTPMTLATINDNLILEAQKQGIEFIDLAENWKSVKEKLGLHASEPDA